MRNSGLDRILKSHRSVAIKAYLEIFSALSADVKHFDGKYLLSELPEFMNIMTNGVSIKVNNIIHNFLTNFKWDISGLTIEEKIKYPNLTQAIIRWSCQGGAYGKALEYKKIKSDCFIITGSIGFSVGSNTYLLAYLIYLHLSGSKGKSLINYTLPAEISLFPVLSEMASSGYQQVINRPILTYKYSYEDLIAICNTKGVTQLTDEVERYLNYYCGLETYKIKTITEEHSYPNSFSEDLVNSAARSMLKRLGLTSIDNSVYGGKLSIMSSQRPIAIIANRDELWVGQGQPWRDSQIDKYIDSIDYLIKKGYTVVRINSRAQTCSYSNKYFLDLAGVDECSSELQLIIASQAKILIGADTGIVGICQLLTHLPTLVVDGADFRPHSPWGRVICCPKRLYLNRDQKTSHILEEVKHFIFQNDGVWDTKSAKKYGLSLNHLSELDILDAVKEFICIIEENGDWGVNYKLEDIGGNKYTNFNTLITSSTYVYYLKLVKHLELWYPMC